MAHDGASLAGFALKKSPGAYALLLGAGISRDTGVPTARDIIESLIRQVAAAREEDPSNLTDWFEKSFGEKGTYGAVLSRLAPTSAERTALLKTFFEPSEEERAAGEKVPTRAHRAIAKLCSKGLIRVIITTNFDRLMEVALEAEGIVPVVIRHADDLEGMLPLPHVNTLVLKVNGDYIDTRIRNTPGELAEYDPRMAVLLERIAAEFGFIVAGWSATHDTALRTALERPAIRPFSSFWTFLTSMSPEAEALGQRMNAGPREGGLRERLLRGLTQRGGST